MTALSLYDAGFVDLVSVIPPGAELSSGSRVNPSDLGKVPGKKGKEGWYGYPFLTAGTPSRAEVARWERDGANVGLLAARYPALDIDVKSEKLGRVVRHFAERVLGPAPVRLSREPRALLVYTTEIPFPRRAMIVEFEGDHHLIEFLSEGRQYLIAGRHPSGVDYRWDGKGLEGASLTAVTEAEVEHFFGALQDFFDQHGVPSEIVGGKRVNAVTVDQEGLKAPSLDQLRDLPLPPNPDEFGWEEFITHGYAYRAAGAEDEALAFDRWCQWSEQNPKHDLTTCEREWAKLERVDNARVGWSWLQEQAEKAGGYTSAQDDFTADPALAHLAEAVLAEAEEASQPKIPRIKFSEEWATAYILPAVQKQLRYTPGKGEEGGTWLVWDAYRWKTDERLEHELVVRELLRRLSIRLQEMAKSAPTKEEGKPFATAAKRFQSRAGIQAVVALVRAHIAVHPTDFDTDPMRLNTPGGVVDLTTGAVAAGTPEEMHARTTKVGPARGPAPLWTRFLADLTGGDVQFTAFLQRFMGYAATGQNTEKVLSYAWGSNSDTGKSTFVRIMDTLFGSYADSVDIEAFISTQKKAGSIPAELARLPGVRLVTATEPAAGHAWDEKRIKAITGGDPIEVRFLYGNPFVYVPQFTIFIVGNNEPELRHVDDAMLRRLLVLPFNRKVPREKQIDNLSARIVEEEGPAVLQWVIDGCLAWQRDGLNPPEVVLQRTAEYAEGQDTLSQWAEEELEVDPDASISRHALFAAWSQWKHARDEYAGKEGSFRETFRPVAEKHKLEEVMVQEGDMRRRGYRGIRLRLRVALGTAAEDFAA